MSKSIYDAGPVFDLPRVPENEHLFKSVLDDRPEEADKSFDKKDRLFVKKARKEKYEK